MGKAVTKGWIYALGWLVFGLCLALVLPPRATGLQAMLRDQIEDDLEANGMTDFKVDMDGQAATLSYRGDAVPSDDPRDRLLKAATIAGNIPGDLPRRGPAGGRIMGPVTVVHEDQGSLDAVLARLDRARAEASAASASSASAAVAASFAAAKACTDDVTQAVASRKLTFLTGSARLSPGSEAILQDIYTTLRKCPDGLVLYVEGHTDNVGGDEHNLELSSSRADAAAAALVRLGLPAASVQSHGYGAADPIADNSTVAGRAKNRRVDFILKPPEQGG